jgi:hypothetical protein
MAHIQVFDWILELIQARQAWMNSPVQQVNALGLLFVAPENSNSQVLISNFFCTSYDLQARIARIRWMCLGLVFFLTSMFLYIRVWFNHKDSYMSTLVGVLKT